MKRLSTLGFYLLVALAGAATTSAVIVGMAVWSARSHAPDGPIVATGVNQFTMIRTPELADAGRSAHGAFRMFNARSCAECHRQAGIGGGGPNENNVRLVNKLFTDRDPRLKRHFGPAPGVAVLHRHSSAPGYAAWRTWLIEKLNPLDPESPRPIQLRLDTSVQPGGLGPTPLEQRNTPPLFGLGLIDSISQRAIDEGLARQAPTIRGRSPRLPGGGRGRFGWKANTATLAAFNENACAVELGLSTPRFAPVKFQPASFRSTPLEIDAPVPKAAEPSRTDHVDMTDADLAELTRFVTALSAPRQLIEPGKAVSVGSGQGIFHTIGCAECHSPDLGKVVGLYSDLSLHSIGTSGGIYYGATSTPEFDIVTAGEFRTPPLWGVADSAPYLHDGSAATLEAAILAHDGQASASRNTYRRLSRTGQIDLIAFLESLRAPLP